MPFDPKNPPTKRVKGLSKLPEKLQRKWVHVWNSMYERMKKEKEGKEPDEGIIYKIAWGAVKERGRRKKKACVSSRVIAAAMMLEKQA
jgi:cation transport regulator ChaB